MRHIFLFFGLLGFLAHLACTPPKKMGPSSGGNTSKPSNKPKYEPMDTVRWSTPTNPKPPIGSPSGTGTQPGGLGGETYRLAYLLPFLGTQYDGATVPEKSRYALQFYAGAKLALQQLSEEGGVNLVVDVYDTQTSDADLQKLLGDTRLRKADVFIGPVRSSQVTLMAAWAKSNRKIVLSPESPNMDLTSQNPDFIQLNPSLRAHCAAIVRHVLQRNRPSAVTLVCKQKEAERLAYCQNANPGTERFAELIMPDEATSFDKAKLSPFLKPGRTNVFIVPSWASQDFINAFLRQLRAVKGNYAVEVYGMPQWQNYESIEPDFFRDLHVHISAASYVNYSDEAVKKFQQAFYDNTGTIPDDDAFNGYDATLFAGRMLRQYGLSFTERLSEVNFTGFHTALRLEKVFATGNGGAETTRPDYWENGFVHILSFGKRGFAIDD